MLVNLVGRAAHDRVAGCKKVGIAPLMYVRIVGDAGSVVLVDRE